MSAQPRKPNASKAPLSNAHVERAFESFKRQTLELVESTLEGLRPLVCAPAADLPLVPCDAVGLTARQVRGLVRADRLAAVLIGRRWYAEPAALRALLSTPAPRPTPANDAVPVDIDRAADELLERVLGETGKRLDEANIAVALRGRKRS